MIVYSTFEIENEVTKVEVQLVQPFWLERVSSLKKKQVSLFFQNDLAFSLSLVNFNVLFKCH